MPDPESALALLNLAKATAGGTVTTFELLPRIGIDFVLKHASGTRDPLAAPSPWYVLMEVSAQNATGLDEAVGQCLADAMEQGLVTDAAIAGSLDQRDAFWRLREMLSEVQRFEGGSIKHDIAVPVHATPDFLRRATAALEALVPGGRVVAFGHLGDGNIHYNLSQPIGADKQAFIARWHEVNDAVHAVVRDLNGSISAEHGIGRLKRDLLPTVKDTVEFSLMQTLKRTLDPQGLLNPGAMLKP